MTEQKSNEIYHVEILSTSTFPLFYFMILIRGITLDTTQSIQWKSGQRTCLYIISSILNE